jgi:hypothetical protein
VVLPGSLGGSAASRVDGDEAVDWATAASLRGTDLRAMIPKVHPRCGVSRD